MRDHRENRIAPIDINLLDQLHSIQSKLNTQREDNVGVRLSQS